MKIMENMGNWVDRGGWGLLFGLIIALHTFILSKLIFFPYPELFIYPYLTDNGLLPYKQIFDQHFPGLMFLPINLNNLGMTNEITARWYLIGAVILTQILIFVISLKIFKDIKKSLLACFIYLIWQPFFEGWVLWIDTFLPLLLLPAFYFSFKAIEDKAKKGKLITIFLAGFFLGLAVLFKQVVIPLSALVAILLFYYRREFKTLPVFLIGFLPVPLLMVAYFWSLGVLKDFWFWTVTFNLTTFAQFGRKPPFFSGVVRILGAYSPIFLLPLLKNQTFKILLAVFLLGSLSGDIARFDFVHFQPSLPFIAIGASAIFFKLWEIRGIWVVRGIRTIFLIYVAVVCWWLVVFYQGHLSNKVMFFDKETLQIAEKIKANTLKGEEIFVLGPVPHLYQMSNTLPAGKIFVFQFPWFLMETEDRFLEVLQQKPPRLIVRDKTVIIEGNPLTHFARKLDNLVDEKYEVFDNVGGVEFLRIKNND